MTRARACPSCRGVVAPRPHNKHWPFCRERCQLADLGRWFAEEYRVPDPTPVVADGDGDGGGDER